MDVISISKKKFDGLERIDLSDINTEGVVYKFSHLGCLKLLKKLYVTDGISIAGKMYTIEMLNSNKDILPSNFIIPESLVSVDKKVEGFALPYISGMTLKSLLSNKDITLECKIQYLKEIGDILDKMIRIRKHTELRHFYLNDIHESNFMVDFDTGKLCVIDLDSCKITPSYCFPSRYLCKNGLLNNVNKYNFDEYKHGSYVLPNQNSDTYCYIILVLNFLYGENINNISINEFYKYLNYLSKIGIDDDLIYCFSRIVSYGENINPKDYLDSLTSEQVCRAKKIVYDRVKK